LADGLRGGMCHGGEVVGLQSKAFEHPDVASLGAEAIEQNPIAVGRPVRIVDAHRGIGELEDLLR